jgi:hypothetical protein
MSAGFTPSHRESLISMADQISETVDLDDLTVPELIDMVALLFPVYTRVLNGDSAPTPLQVVRDGDEIDRWATK